jgi:hypothetical protein
VQRERSEIIGFPLIRPESGQQKFPSVLIHGPKKSKQDCFSFSQREPAVKPLHEPARKGIRSVVGECLLQIGNTGAPVAADRQAAADAGAANGQ